jgi:glutamate-1-semialdehyde 2,1-aminomutase
VKFDISKKLFKEAKKYLVGGVNSPVRAFRAVGGDPVFIKRAKGSKIFDEDGNRFIDYVMSWGALILGHSNQKILKKIEKALYSGTSFGASTQKEIELAKIIADAVPSIDLLRLVNSGTEATMSSIRLARGYTGKNKIIKFEGCYHGHSDSLLVRAGSGAATFGVPDSKGVTASISRDTIVCPYNDIGAASRLIRQRHKEIACVIVEPVAANMGVVLPETGFLSALRELTAKHKIVLIFDEVICGFRFCFGSAGGLFGINPDLICLGKIIGGGLPLAAYGGKRDIMESLSPLGPVYQAGTLSGNPIAVTAGIATLKMLSKADYVELNQKTSELCDAMEEILKINKMKFSVNRAGSIFTLFFNDKKVYDFATAKRSDTKKYAKFFRSMLRQGINLPPSQYEANFMSFAHTDEDIHDTLKAFAKALKQLKNW